MAKTTHKYEPGDKVFLVDDPEQHRRTIIAMIKTALGIQYSIRIDGELVDFFEIELADDKNVI